MKLLKKWWNAIIDFFYYPCEPRKSFNEVKEEVNEQKEEVKEKAKKVADKTTKTIPRVDFDEVAKMTKKEMEKDALRFNIKLDRRKKPETMLQSYKEGYEAWVKEQKSNL